MGETIAWKIDLDLELRLASPSRVPPPPPISSEASRATVGTNGAASRTVSDLVVFAASLTLAAPDSDGVVDTAIGQDAVLPGGDAASKKRAKTDPDEETDGETSCRRRPPPPTAVAAAAAAVVSEPAWVRAELFPLHGLPMDIAALGLLPAAGALPPPVQRRRQPPRLPLRPRGRSVRPQRNQPPPPPPQRKARGSDTRWRREEKGGAAEVRGRAGDRLPARRARVRAEAEQVQWHQGHGDQRRRVRQIHGGRWPRQG